MLSGGRYCLRTKVKQEPSLLFLYPRWFITQQHPHPLRSLRHDPPENTELTFSYKISHPRREREDKAVQASHSHHVLQPSSENPSEANLQDYSGNTTVLDSATEQKFRIVLSRRRARQGLVVRERGPDGLHHRSYLPAPGSTSSPSRSENEKTKKNFGVAEATSWERTVVILANSVPRQKEIEGEEIWVSKETLVVVSGTSGHNSWVHHVRGGCEIQVTEIQSSCGTSRQVFLRGSARAIALTREHFDSLESGRKDNGEAQVGASGTLEPQEIELIAGSNVLKPDPEFVSALPDRHVLTAIKSHLRNQQWMRADDFPSPTTYDVRSFKEYVEDLTTMKTPRLVNRELYGVEDDKRNMVVANILYRLFTDANTARFASAVAMNLAFAFLCKRTELFGQLDRLYGQCRQLPLTMQPQTYSYVLRTMLPRNENELIGFRRVLDDMLSEGHSPNSQIWLALLQSGSSSTQKSIVADWMHRKGLLQNSMVKGQVASQIVKDGLNEGIHHQMDAALFISSIDARFGPDWMSPFAITQILLACASHKENSLSIEIFREAQKRNVSFKTTAISTLLTVAQRRGSLRDSLDFLSSHFVKTIGRNDRVLIPIIFMTAWKHRFYNVSRVLWRYAAILGAITYKMQNIVTQSLLRNQDISTPRAAKAGLTVANQEWKRRAGKVLVGINADISGLQQQSTRPAVPLNLTSTKNPTILLTQFTSDGQMRDQQLSLAYFMMHCDLEAWKHFTPPSSQRLFKLLSEAYAIDVRWKSEGVGLDRGGKSTQWMIENAIDVPLVKRQISLLVRPC
jgi:hypothetical protein